MELIAIDFHTLNQDEKKIIEQKTFLIPHKDYPLVFFDVDDNEFKCASYYLVKLRGYKIVDYNTFVENYFLYSKPTYEELVNILCEIKPYIHSHKLNSIMKRLGK